MCARPNLRALAVINGVCTLPGGYTITDKGLVSVYLQNMSNKSIIIKYGFCVNDGEGNLVAYK
jgi:hypothetical protein